MEIFDEERLSRSLAGLDAWKRVAFIAMTCDRMVPNYDRFSAETNFGDPMVLRRGLDVAWEWLETNTLSVDLNSLTAQVEEQAPNTDQFASPFTSAALDASNAIAVLLNALCHPGCAAPVEVACLARDTVDLYVQDIEKLDPNDPNLEEAIRRHPLMQAELRRQRTDLERIERWAGLRGEAAQLRSQGASAMGSLVASIN
jgi:uncharacterized protein YjaG (DUF416 family)